MEWLYEHNQDNSARFVLGTVGSNPLVCFGINPSTAEPSRLDRTARAVQTVAERSNQFDSFIILNVYPQRATNPDNMHREFSKELKEQNEQHIAKVIDDKKLTLWAAWGTSITKRPYLIHLLQDIIKLPQVQKCEWRRQDNLTKAGHPRHPLYLRRDANFTDFQISSYLLDLDVKK
jgi:hypothetical protein